MRSEFAADGGCLQSHGAPGVGLVRVGWRCLTIYGSARAGDRESGSGLGRLNTKRRFSYGFVYRYGKEGLLAPLSPNPSHPRHILKNEYLRVFKMWIEILGQVVFYIGDFVKVDYLI